MVDAPIILTTMKGSMSDSKIINGDCLKKLQDVQDQSIDLILADPPYGITACTWDSIIPLKPLWEQLKRITEGAIVLNCTQPFTTTLISSNREMFKYCWIWKKNGAANISTANKRPMKYHEELAVFYVRFKVFNKQMIPRTNPTIRILQKRSTKICSSPSSQTDLTPLITDPHKYDKNWKNPSDILEIARVHCKCKIHPTEKPVALMEYMVKTYTNEGDTVLDFCMGSGTTGVACKKLNRRFIGIETSKYYCRIAQERIDAISA